MERHNNQQSGRMPRACKRGRPPKADLRGVRSSGRGQSACMAHAELHQEQDNRRYGEPIPEVTLHYPNTGATPSPMQQPSVSYGRTQKRSRTESAELSNIMLQNQSRSRYCSQQEQYSSYRPLQTMCDRNPIVNNLVKASQDFKISLLTRYYFMVFRAGLPGLTTNPAITYQDPDNNNESDSSPLQQLSPMLLQSLIGDGTPPPNAADSNTTSQSTDTPSPQPQVPQSLQQSETRPENLTLPIPTTAADWNNYRRYQAFRYPGRTQIRPNFNTTCQFLQNNTQMHHDSNYSSRVYHPEQFGMPGWF